MERSVRKQRVLSSSDFRLDDVIIIIKKKKCMLYVRAPTQKHTFYTHIQTHGKFPFYRQIRECVSKH